MYIIMSIDNPNNEKLQSIVDKWQKTWDEKKIFNPEPDSRKKFFVNFPFPYVNGNLHLGHLFSFMRLDVMARYKRMKDYNVLFPQGYHATGQPIIAAASLIKEKDEKQIKILKSMGITDEEIVEFEDPMHWIKYFSKNAKEDLKKSGSSIDWRRSFITTDLNPAFDSFVRWQYNVLNRKNYVVKGSHPVVWCPKASQPIGDHDRKEGEGVTPDEVSLVKFKDSNGRVFPAMTFRPETVFGVTNMWINPNGEYCEVDVKYEIENTNFEETWIVAKNAVESLKMQKYSPIIKKEIIGKELISIELENPVNNTKIKTFRADFVNMDNGTGVVMSVPAHAPFDYVALRDIGEDKNIDLIPLIKVEGYKQFPAKEIVESMKIKDQNDEKLKIATKEIYKKEFHTGVLNEKLGEYAGRKVSEVKEELINEFTEKGFVTKYYTLAQTVISRQNAKAIVALVENQYFLNYSNPEWKELAHKCVDNMRFYPKDSKQNYHYTIDWLKDWACARDKGIGTKLPWDKDWLIESLSDSTIYMAYYTIAKYLENAKEYNIVIEDIKDSFYDFVMLSKGDLETVSKENNLTVELLKQIKEEFEYWYKNGYDFRSSGKDLIQNHLTFSIFHHVAIFEEKNWPSGISVNGHILLDNEKMSKSKGNFITFRDAIKLYGVDSSRFSMVFASDVTINDANFDTRIAKSMNDKFVQMIEFAQENYNKGVEKYRNIDLWFENKINKTIEKTDYFYENSETRSALQTAYYDLNNDFKWYAKRTANNFNKDIINRFIEVQTLLLSPAIPHICEEIWEIIGKKELISNSKWPELTLSEYNEIVEKENLIIVEIYNKVNKIKEIKKIDNVSKITLIKAEDIRYELFEKLNELLKETKDFKTLFEEIKKETRFEKEMKFVQKFLPKTLKDGLTTYIGKELENKLFDEIVKFLKEEFNCEVEITNVEKTDLKISATPGDPGIIIE